MVDHHNQDVTRLKEEHRAILDGQRAQTEQLRNEIEKLKKNNEEIMNQINQDADMEINEIEKKNQDNQNNVLDMSLKSKAEL